MLTKTRIDFIDKIKGFAILLVVIGHVIQFNTDDFRHNIFFSIIYSFHMPLFFFLSGYIAANSKQIISVSVFKNSIIKKSIQLIIPLISWAIIATILNNNISLTFGDLLNTVLGQFTNPSLWFLHTLFLLFLANYTLEFLLIKLKIEISILIHFSVTMAVLLTIIGLSKFYPSIISFALNYLFFMLGLFVCKYGVLNLFYQNKLTFLTSCLAFIMLSFSYDFSQSMATSQKLIKLTASFFATIVFYNIFKPETSWLRINTSLKTMGGASLVIYVTHLTLIAYLPLHFSYSNPAIQSIAVIVMSLIWIVFCVTISHKIMLVPKLDFILYGRKTYFPK
jgi:fucose 4-O-acetylase-like acetyltransferase